MPATKYSNVIQVDDDERSEKADSTKKNSSNNSTTAKPVNNNNNKNRTPNFSDTSDVDAAAAGDHHHHPQASKTNNNSTNQGQHLQQHQQKQQQRAKKKVKYSSDHTQQGQQQQQVTDWNDEPSLPNHVSVSQVMTSNNNSNSEDEAGPTNKKQSSTAQQQRKTSFADSVSDNDSRHTNDNDTTDNDNDNHNNNNRYSRDDMAGSVISDESGDHSLGSGDDGDEDGMHSSISGSSGSSLGTKGLKSSIPCSKQLGCTIVHLMTISILVPIIFLVVFTGIPLSESIAADRFLDKHRPVFIGIRTLGDYNLWERLNSSFVISNNASHPEYAAHLAGLTVARKLFDAEATSFNEGVMRGSDIKDRVLFMRDFDLLLRMVAVDRERVDLRAAVPNHYRDRQIELTNQMNRLLFYFAHDKRGEVPRQRIILYVFIRRIQNLFSATFGAAIGVVNAGNDTAAYTNHVRALQSAYDGVTSDLNQVHGAADPAVTEDLAGILRSPNWNKWLETVKILLDDDKSKFANLTDDNLALWYQTAETEFDEVDRRVLDRIMAGELLAAVALENALMMVFALLSSCVALAIVIYYNNKEQKRMERALDGTAVLANAVQRFVPKNQLKTMGVRSITQVQPGMTTEVAQTITFTDIRGFTRLSESMTRLELFDWLQNYVARMTKVISEEKSYIMAFLGDGLGICSPQPTYALNAAVKMHVSVEEMNLNLVASGKSLLVHIGVGVSHGIVVAGVFGDANRLTCTMIAPTVNFASRLEALTKAFGVKILASESTIDHISSDVFSFRKVGKVQVAGSSESVAVYDVYNADDIRDKDLKTETKPEFEHAVSIYESDPPAAVKIFEGLVLRARMKGRSDECAEMYRKRFQTGGTSGATSVLSFEKDGELKPASPTLTDNLGSCAEYSNVGLGVESANGSGMRNFAAYNDSANSNNIQHPVTSLLDSTPLMAKTPKTVRDDNHHHQSNRSTNNNSPANNRSATTLSNASCGSASRKTITHLPKRRRQPSPQHTLSDPEDIECPSFKSTTPKNANSRTTEE